MENIFVINDWMTAPIIKNDKHPTYKITVQCYRKKIQDDYIDIDVIDGYKLKVTDLCHNEVIYAFDIDRGASECYSLTTPEAIEFLNIIGFPCRFDTKSFVISDRVYKELKAFKDLGYVTITRIIRPTPEIVISVDPSDVIERKPFFLDKRFHEYRWLPKGYVSPELINYNDYSFLDANCPTLIDEIIKKYENNVTKISY